MSNIIPTESKCGDCTVCCEIMGFTGLWKSADRYNEAESYGVNYGAWSTCNKLCDTGCSIQADKPKICDEFFCSYVEHDLENDMQRLHIILDIVSSIIFYRIRCTLLCMMSYNMNDI